MTHISFWRAWSGFVPSSTSRFRLLVWLSVSEIVRLSISDRGVAVGGTVAVGVVGFEVLPKAIISVSQGDVRMAAADEMVLIVAGSLVGGAVQARLSSEQVAPPARERVFAVGVVVSFLILAALFYPISSQGWAFQMRNPWFVYGISILLLVIALNMAGVFEFGTKATGVGPADGVDRIPT